MQSSFIMQQTGGGSEHLVPVTFLECGLLILFKTGPSRADRSCCQAGLPQRPSFQIAIL